MNNFTISYIIGGVTTYHLKVSWKRSVLIFKQAISYAWHKTFGDCCIHTQCFHFIQKTLQKCLLNGKCYETFQSLINIFVLGGTLSIEPSVIYVNVFFFFLDVDNHHFHIIIVITKVSNTSFLYNNYSSYYVKLIFIDSVNI